MPNIVFLITFETQSFLPLGLCICCKHTFEGDVRGILVGFSGFCKRVNAICVLLGSCCLGPSIVLVQVIIGDGTSTRSGLI